MRLAFIITGLATGGAEMMLLKLLARIDRSRFDPYVISLTTNGEIGPRIEALGVPVEAFDMRPGMPEPLAFFQLARRLRALKPDVAQTWMYHADLVGGLAARAAGVRTLAWGIRNSDLSKDRTKLTTRIVVHACALISHSVPRQILFCSEASRAIHLAAGYAKDKTRLIPNGFDLACFTPDPVARDSVRGELGLPAAAQLVGLIGRYDPQKNHLGFIAAASRISAVLPNAHYLLAGGGVDGANFELTRAINNAGAAGRFHLLGRRDDMPRLMAALDVLASSSYGEAFPNVVGEAMACAVPCAVTDVGDSAYIVGDAGRVAASGDMEGLSRAIIELLSAPEAQRFALGQRARARVAELFEIGRVVRRYEAFYEELASGEEPAKRV